MDKEVEEIKQRLVGSDKQLSVGDAIRFIQTLLSRLGEKEREIERLQLPTDEEVTLWLDVNKSCHQQATVWDFYEWLRNRRQAK